MCVCVKNTHFVTALGSPSNNQVLSMEYNEFAKGTRKTISQVDFARILLRYAALNADE